MRITKSDRGFQFLEHDTYPSDRSKNANARLASQSSLINPEYEDAMSRPGSSYLWIGEHHHLDREQVARFVAHLQSWLDTGSLEPTKAIGAKP